MNKPKMFNKINLQLLCLAIIFCDTKLTLAQKVITVPETPNLTHRDYRLQPVIIPENYKIIIRLDENFHNTKKFTLENCTVKFNISKSVKAHQEQIRIHYDLDYASNNSVRLYDVNGVGMDVKMGPPHPDTQIAVITLQHKDYLDKEFEPFFLEFANIKGTLRDDSNGFYLSHYKYENKTKFIATTQFESTFARSAFPCFDEPAYKSTFDISIKKPSNYTTVLSNAKKLREDPIRNSNLTIVTFDRTPIMSTYLVAFIVSSFENITDPENSNYVTYFPEGHKESALYAASISRKIAQDIGNKTGISYSDLGNPKLYQIAVPDFSAGAMENWGLITYRESALLWDPKQSTKRNKRQVLTVVSHEISHSWFGNSVTLDWWSQTWLNEGFATYFEYHIAADIEPDFDLRNQFVYDVVQYVLEEDSISTMQQLSSKADDIFTPDQIRQKFNSISYEKGGSVIRMIEHVMTTPRFLAALHTYLTKHRSNNTIARDLIVDLELEGLPKDAIKDWIYHPGYPVVTVRRVNNDAILMQQRFLIDEAISNTTWQVPISYASKNYNKHFNETKPQHWLNKTNDLVIKDAFNNSNWIVINVQQTGYYRVDYDAALWENLTAALKSDNFSGIIPINRAQIIDDVMNMARTKRQSYKVAMDLTNYLLEDVDFYPWASAMQSFRYLLKHVKGDKDLLASLKSYLSKLSTNIIESAHFAQNPLDSYMATTKNVLVLNWAASLEIESCIKNATHEFALYKANPESHYINPNVKNLVYCLGIAYGNDIEWDFMYGQFLKTNISSERNIILSSLGCSTNQTILQKFLDYSLNETSGIRKQDADDVLSSVMSSNARLAFDFLKNRHADIIKHYTSMGAISNILYGFADIFTTKSDVEDFTRFIKEHKDQLAGASGIVADNAIKTAEANLKWMDNFGEELQEWLKAEKAGSGVIKASFVVVLVVSVFVTLFNLYSE